MLVEFTFRVSEPFASGTTRTSCCRSARLTSTSADTGMSIFRSVRAGWDALHFEARLRLFPRAGPKLLPPDVDQLIEAFNREFSPLVKDRHANRAHPYEHEQAKKPTVRMLRFPEVRTHVEYAHQVLKDLSVVASGTSFDLRNAHATNVKAAASEFVEMLLLTATARQRLRESATPFDAFFDDLHAHDRSPPADALDDEDGPPRPAFNDRPAIWRALTRLRLEQSVPGDFEDD